MSLKIHSFNITEISEDKIKKALIYHFILSVSMRPIAPTEEQDFLFLTTKLLTTWLLSHD